MTKEERRIYKYLNRRLIDIDKQIKSLEEQQGKEEEIKELERQYRSTLIKANNYFDSVSKSDEVVDIFLNGH